MTGFNTPGREHCSLAPANTCRLERPATRRCGPKPLTTTGIVEVMAAINACRPAVVAESAQEGAAAKTPERCLQLLSLARTRLPARAFVRSIYFGSASVLLLYKLS